MNDNKIRKKIKEISKLYMDISIHQIIALYEDELNCNEEVYKNEDEKIEKIYKCINKIRDEQINENKTIDLIMQYLNYEEPDDAYFYEDTLSTLLCELEAIFENVGIDIATETREIRDDWKREIFKEKIEKIEELQSSFDSVFQEKSEIEENLKKHQKALLKITDENKRNEDKVLELENTLNDLKKNEIVMNEKLVKSLAEIESLNRVIEVENEKKRKLLEKINNQQNETTNNKEIEHLKKGIDLLKIKLKEYEGVQQEKEQLHLEVRKLKEERINTSEIDKLKQEKNDLEITKDRLEKQVKDLKEENNKKNAIYRNEVDRLNKIIEEMKIKERKASLPKIDIEEAKEQIYNIYIEIKDCFKKIISDRNMPKTIDGKNISMMMNKITTGILTVGKQDSIEGLSQELDCVIKELLFLDKMLKGNGNIADFMPNINRLKELSERI